MGAKQTAFIYIYALIAVVTIIKSMRYSTLILPLFFLIQFGCKQAPTDTVQDPVEVSENTKNITPQDIDSIRFNDYALSDDSQKACENWIKYQELNEQIGYLTKADFSFFNVEKKIMKTFINDFRTEMPETVKSAPILSRVTALETKLLKLNSVLRLDNVNKAVRLEHIKEVLVAMSNLNLQINKKFELEANLVDKDEAGE